MYIRGFRARQHLRSLAPVMYDEWWWWRRPNDIRGPCEPKAPWHLSYRWGKTPKDNTHQAHIHSYQQGEYGIMTTAAAKWYSGTLWAYNFPSFVLHVRKNPEKTSPRKPVPTGDRTRARCVTSAHATTCSTAVDVLRHKFLNITIYD